jgi:methylmalonyl-CoA mutase N-terminal domain/subunit
VVGVNVHTDAIETPLEILRVSHEVERAQVAQLAQRREERDPAAVEKELAGLPSLHAGGITKPPAGADGAAVMDPDEARAIALLGIDPKAYAEQKKKLGLNLEAG